MRSLVDLTLNIQPVAWAIAQLLSARTMPENVTGETFPWYNGRERGIGIKIERSIRDPSNPLGIRTKNLVLVWYEYRQSDSLCVLKWENSLIYMNPPNLETDFDWAFPDQNSSSPTNMWSSHEHTSVVNYIVGEIEMFSGSTCGYK